MQVSIDKIVDFGVLSCIFRRELLHCGNSLLRRLHAIATAAVARPAVGEGNGPPRVHGSKEPLAKLVAEDAANERKRPLMPPHSIAVGEEETLAHDLALHTAINHLHANLARQVVENPYIVVANEPVQLHSGIA